MYYMMLCTLFVARPLMQQEPGTTTLVPSPTQKSRLASFREMCGGWVEAPRQLVSGFFSSASPLSPETIHRMEQFRTYMKIPYNKDNSTHEDMLLHYWEQCFPAEPLKTRESRQWKQLGFQGTDPASDFRGAGIFGLRCLMYFAISYPYTFRDMLQGPCTENQERYRFSIAGLNIIHMLSEFLGWGFKQTPQNPNLIRNLVHLLFESETDDAKVPKLKDLFDFADPGGPGNTEQNFMKCFASVSFVCIENGTPGLQWHTWIFQMYYKTRQNECKRFCCLLPLIWKRLLLLTWPLTSPSTGVFKTFD